MTRCLGVRTATSGRYNLLGKLETFQEDLSYIASITGIPVWKTSARDAILNQISTSESEEVTKSLVSQLSKKQKGRLLEMYELDLEAFGYDAEPLPLVTLEAED